MRDNFLVPREGVERVARRHRLLAAARRDSGRGFNLTLLAFLYFHNKVPREGVEPSSREAYAPEAYVFANFTTAAGFILASENLNPLAWI